MPTRVRDALITATNDDCLVTSVFLAHHRSRPDSYWRPYIDALPQEGGPDMSLRILRMLVSAHEHEADRGEGDGKGDAGGRGNRGGHGGNSDGGAAVRRLVATSPSLAGEVKGVVEENELSKKLVADTVLAAYPEAFGPDPQADLVWALNMVRSRSWGPGVGGQDTRCTLVPLLDMLNHRTGRGLITSFMDVEGMNASAAETVAAKARAAIAVAADASMPTAKSSNNNIINNNTAPPRPADSTTTEAALAVVRAASAAAVAAGASGVNATISGVGLVADREVVRGEEICDTYDHHADPKCNEKFLSNYGFILPEEPLRDCFTLNIALPNTTDPARLQLFALRERHLVARNLSKLPTYFRLRVPSPLQGGGGGGGATAAAAQGGEGGDGGSSTTAAKEFSPSFRETFPDALMATLRIMVAPASILALEGVSSGGDEASRSHQRGSSGSSSTSTSNTSSTSSTGSTSRSRGGDGGIGDRPQKFPRLAPIDPIRPLSAAIEVEVHLALRSVLQGALDPIVHAATGTAPAATDKNRRHEDSGRSPPHAAMAGATEACSMDGGTTIPAEGDQCNHHHAAQRDREVMRLLEGYVATVRRGEERVIRHALRELDAASSSLLRV